MKPYEHPSIVVEQPAPGHFVIRGHNPANVTSAAGQIVPLRECYITEEIPTDLLLAILEDRPDFPPLQTFNPGELDEALKRNGELSARAEKLENDKGEISKELSALRVELDAALAERDELREKHSAKKGAHK